MNDKGTLKRVTLPSGRTIDVTFFDRERAEDAVVTPPERALHICPVCRSEFVYPLEWGEVAQLQWEVTLRCPECERIETGVFPQTMVDAFDDVLDEGSGYFEAALREFTRDAMETEADLLAAAFAADLLGPEDVCR